MENGKTRPSADLVRLYDTAFDADGLLLAGYAEARAAGTFAVDRVQASAARTRADAMEIVGSWPALGELAVPDSRVELRWLIRNVGKVAWRGRTLARVGAVGGARLITGTRSTPIRDLEPGDTAEVSVPVHLPALHATVVAYWQVLDSGGKSCFPGDPLLSAHLVIM